jgi:molecular chaperone HscB
MRGKRGKTKIINIFSQPASPSHSPRTYAVDIADLDRRYKALQSVLHPDKHAAAGDQAAAAADAASAAVNTAYATLRCPLARAVYMVRNRLGVV